MRVLPCKSNPSCAIPDPNQTLLPCARQFFASGKVLPVERGAGLGQPAVALAARLAASGGWLHLFPEARLLPWRLRCWSVCS